MPQHSYFVEMTQDRGYDGIGDDLRNQDTRGPNRNGANSQYEQPFNNPYYEGGLDGITPGNARQGKNPTCSNLNDTDIVTAAQNVYYDL